ncbi:hypothetical protein ABZ215_01855 [Amycolatopsis sp. NPDC006131]|uniref:hypothetical protein n=1 Tax=Amycolatopsis sp. NPDC006131 TaxID=3156731 RepID=UPI0033BAF924
MRYLSAKVDELRHAAGQPVGEYTRRESSVHYGRTKLVAIVFSQELARRLAGTGGSAVCCDPGFDTTALGRELPFAGLLEKTLRGLRTDDTLASGGYYSVRDAQPLDCPKSGRGAEIQRRPWDETARLL